MLPPLLIWKDICNKNNSLENEKLKKENEKLKKENNDLKYKLDGLLSKNEIYTNYINCILSKSISKDN